MFSGGKKIPWTFKTWITRFKDVDLPIGDLAKDISGDEEFPNDLRGGNSFETIFEHVAIKSNYDGVILRTFCEVWNFYAASNYESDLPTEKHFS